MFGVVVVELLLLCPPPPAMTLDDGNEIDDVELVRLLEDACGAGGDEEDAVISPGGWYVE